MASQDRAGMIHRERVLAAIEQRPVDRIPTDMWATPEIADALTRHFDCATLRQVWDYMDVDGIVGVGPDYRGPALPEVGEGRTIDEWGMGGRWQQYATGGYWEQDVYPLAEAETIADVDAYRWPEPRWYDYSVIPDKARDSGGRAVMYGYTAIFFWHNKLRGLELSLMDVLLRPEFTRHLVRRIAETFAALYESGYQAGRGLLDITQVTDDFGSQHGLLVSRGVFERFYRPYMEQAITLAKSYGLKVFHHDDGAIRDIIPDLLDMGIDVLNPIQWRCPGMEREGLVRDFGGRVCFHGGVDNQQTLAFGSADDVRAEVEYDLKTLGGSGTGYILAPCHNIQPVTPLANVLAMYETAHRLGRR
jgi:uroporphyrinogen decarboxylase